MLSGGLKIVLIGDGEGPELLKWARALAPRVQVHALSSRGFLPEWNWVAPDAQRLALNLQPQSGWNQALLGCLPRVGAWLKATDPDWLHAHDLASLGTLAWAARVGWRLRARLAASVGGGDIVFAPRLGLAYLWMVRKTLKACAVVTAESQAHADTVRELGAADVMIVPGGLEAMPRQTAKKEPWLFFANGGLEPAHRPQLVIEAFARVLKACPPARLVMAGDGPLRPYLEADVAARGLADKVSFLGRLDAADQAHHRAKASWYVSLPERETASLEVLEAMGHACVPILSDLPAHRTLIGDSERGLILDNVKTLAKRMAQIDATQIGVANRQWVAQHGLFEPGAQRFLTRLRELSP